MPRGKLEVILVKGTDLKYREENFRPVMEFRIGNQRVLIDEDVKALKASWRHNLIEFETHSQWDMLEIRFFNDQDIQLKDGGRMGGMILTENERV